MEGEYFSILYFKVNFIVYKKKVLTNINLRISLAGEERAENNEVFFYPTSRN